jgi:hypothetical protein
MTLVGFMGFLDPAKASAKPAIKSLQQHGVAVKVLHIDLQGFPHPDKLFVPRSHCRLLELLPLLRAAARI